MFVLATLYHDTAGGSEILQPFGMHENLETSWGQRLQKKTGAGFLNEP